MSNVTDATASSSAAVGDGFDSLGICRDPHGRPIMARIKCGSKYIYRYLPDTPDVYMLEQVTGFQYIAPDDWCGDLFIDSHLRPILFRYRSVADDADPHELRYARVVGKDMMLAVIREDEDEIERLLATVERESVRDAVEESNLHKRLRGEPEVDSIVTAAAAAAAETHKA